MRHLVLANTELCSQAFYSLTGMARSKNIKGKITFIGKCFSNNEEAEIEKMVKNTKGQKEMMNLRPELNFF